MDLNQIIEAGEDSHTEFKAATFHNDSLAKEIVAFANMKGGVVYIGITDDGKLQDISPDTEERVVNICRNAIQPSLIPDIGKIRHAGGNLLVVHIEQGKYRPYKVKNSNKFYIRAGSVSIEPTNEELVRLFQDGEQLHFEVSPVFAWSRQQFDLLRFRDYIERYRDLEYEEEDLQTLLYNLQCTDEQQRVSVLGCLFFASHPARHLPQCGVELFAFAGEDRSSEVLDYQIEECGIVQAIEQAIQFVKKNNQTPLEFDQDTGHRIEHPCYDMSIMRELVVNAFMHRDWSIFGQRVRLSLFSNRLEIFSPGKLPNTLNITRALAGISYYRNPIIAQMLKDYKLADRAGRGLQKIVKQCHKNNLPQPHFDATLDYFQVTVWMNPRNG